MSKVWYCVNCGYEVGSRGRCHRCKERLRLAPLAELAPGDEENEVGYRLGDWEDATRGRLIESLMVAAIPHRFEDDELVVALEDEERVDDLVAETAEVPAGAVAEVHLIEDVLPLAGVLTETYVPGIGLVDAEGKPLEDGRGGQRAHFAVIDSEELEELAAQVHRLHYAAVRLRADPTDMEADGDVAEASAAVFMTDQFPGLNTEVWAGVGRTTRRLLAALGAEEALDEEISRQAGILAALLDVIADDAATAEAATAEAATAEAATAEAAAGEAAMAAEDTAAQADDSDLGTGAAPDGEAAEDGAGEQRVGLGAEGHEDGEAQDDEAPGLPLEIDDLYDLAGHDDGDEEGGHAGETVYELPTEWLPEQRAELSVLLEEAGIAATWDRGDLIVPEEREAEVEALFDRVHGVQNTDSQDEAQYQEISELFAATSRLAGDPDDPARAAEVLRTVGAVEGTAPFGFDGVKWSAIRKRARTLADSIEHKAQQDVVSSEASSLRDLLRELV